MSNNLQDLTKDSILLSSITAEAVKEVIEILEAALIENNIVLVTTDKDVPASCANCALNSKICNSCILPGEHVLICLALERYKNADKHYSFSVNDDSNIHNFSRTVSTASNKAYWDVENAKKAIENVRVAHA